MRVACSQQAAGLGVADKLRHEFKKSQSAVYADMRERTPALQYDAGRWVGEMEEIAATFRRRWRHAGLHRGRRAMLPAARPHPVAAETRETKMNRDRDGGIDALCAIIEADG